MQTTTIRGGVPLTRVGLGGAPLGNLFAERTDEQVRAAVDAAWDAGVRYVDTAPHYGLGLSEVRIGDALRDRPRAGYVVSTKVGRLLVPSPGTADQWDDDGFRVPATVRREWDFSRDGVRRSLESSLERLGLDRVDVVYLHDPDDHWDAASTTGVDALVELRDEGVVGAIGAGMNQTAMLTEFVRRCDVDVVMCAGRWTLLDRSAGDELLPLAVERGVAVVAAGVYNSGLLARAVVPDDAHFHYRSAPPEVLERARAMARACAEHGVTLPDAAVAFPLRHPAVASVVIGAGDAQQVREGVARSQVEIPDELWTSLDEVLR